MKIRRHFWWLGLSSVCLSFLTTARADVRLPAIFGDHMVLQEKSKLPVWGWASPGEKITVTFKGQKKTTTAAADGTWRLDLKPVDPGGEAGTLTVAGNNTLTFTDVLVGDVWVASGQSNMEFGIQTDSRGKEAVANATDSQIRFFFVPWATALKPQTDIGPAIFTTRKDCQPLRSEQMTGRPGRMKNSSVYLRSCLPVGWMLKDNKERRNLATDIVFELLRTSLPLTRNRA